MVREAEHAESKKDFVHKKARVQKEVNETLYWLELLHEGNYLGQDEYESLHKDAVEVIKIVTSIVKSAKNNP